MDRYQLCEELRAAGVPAGRYEIADCPGGPWPADRLYLKEQDDQWTVGVHERGRREVLERFPDENQACRYLYARLTDEGQPPVPLTGEESERLLHDSEGIQRRAHEQLERALDAGRRPLSDDPSY